MGRKSWTLSVLSVLLLLSGCNGEVAAVAPEGEVAKVAPLVAAQVVTSGCTVTQSASAVTINCADGSSATFSGSGGGAPQYRLRDSAGNILGTRALGPYSAVDDANGVVAEYTYSGAYARVPGSALYFASTDCSGAALLLGVQNTLVVNNGLRYMVSASSPVGSVQSRSIGGVCSAYSATGVYSTAVEYTGSLPAEAALPLKFEQF